MLVNVFTIGHSNHPFGKFVSLLHRHSIQVICDVRSSPRSRFEQYCQSELRHALQNINVQYVHAGRSLGARSSDSTDYIKGQVQFDRLAQKPLFKKAIGRLIDDSSKRRIALMCAEAEPLECHRSILVSRQLELWGAKVIHILPEGLLETHSDSMKRLTRMLELPEAHLFLGTESLLDEAYRIQEKKIAYRDVRPPEDSQRNPWGLAS